MVTHFSQANRPPLCGAGWYKESPPTTDKAKVTCKRCLRWIAYYANKKVIK